MNSLTFGFKLGIRQARAGKWTIIFLGLWLAVSAFTAQYILNQRLQQALNKQAAINLGGDIALSSPSPLPPEWISQAKALQLSYAEVRSFSSVVVAGSNLQLAQIQAVSPHYPLMGLQVLRAPEKRTIRMDKRLMAGLNIGLNQEVQIGVAHFKVISNLDENENILSGLSFAPRLMMNLEDVESTKTVLPGSQVEYRLLLAGDAQKIKDYQQWVKSHLHANQKLWNVQNQRLLASGILKQAVQYLGIVIILCLIISGVTLVVGSQHYFDQQQFSIALLRCLGLKQSQIIQVLLWQLMSIAFMVSVLGIATGLGLNFLLLKSISTLLPLQNTAVPWLPVVAGIGLSFVLLSLLVLPVLIKLRHVVPISLWRDENKQQLNFSWMMMILTGLTACLLFWILFPHLLWILWLLNSFVVIAGFFYLLFMLGFRVLKVGLENTRGILRRAGLNIIHHEAQSSFYMICFSIIIMSVLTLYAIRSDLFSTWQQELPLNTPNYFALNIAPEQVSELSHVLEHGGVALSGVYPMVRGRLIALNHHPILEAVPVSARHQNVLYRELNLSWMTQFPSDNKIVEGIAWDRNVEGKPWISMEKELAETLDIKLGDILTFQIGESQISGEVKNLRTLQWRSFHPNFLFIFSPGILAHLPTTYISSFYIAPHQQMLLNTLTQTFPNMTIIDASSLLQQVKTLLSEGITAMQFAFILTLVGGMLLLIACIQMTLTRREKSYRLMRMMGASQSYLQGSLLIEFCLTGIYVGLLGALCATLIALGIAHFVLEISYQWDLSLFLWGAMLGLLSLSLPAWWFTRKIVKVAPMLRG